MRSVSDLSYGRPRTDSELRAGIAYGARWQVTTRATRGARSATAGQLPVNQGGQGMTEYVTAITFPQTSTTYEAFSKLSDAVRQYGVRSAGIVERDAQGHLRVPESGDTDRLDKGDEAIAAFGRLIPPGGNAILAVTDEVTTDPLEQFAAGFGGKVTRRPLDEVLAELEAQDEAAREADKAARKAIREQKKQERKEDFQTRVDALKAKFHQE